MNNRLVHDTAWMASGSMTDDLTPLFPEADAAALRDYFYEHVKAAIEVFRIQKSREEQRLKPSDN